MIMGCIEQLFFQKCHMTVRSFM